MRKGVAACVVVLTSSMAFAAWNAPVRVDGGLVAPGEQTATGITVFQGIPYAAPPVGELRWREPQPVRPWNGVRKSDALSKACMQMPHPKGSYYQIEFYPTPEPVSEDCLYLNVWTPAHSSAERLPVMVWIHGGGFAQGSGATASQTGETLARMGVVVVTFNYRLGIFGLLAHPELTKESEHHCSGNYALMDEIAALKWVQRNIAAFGGDRERVTVFGQSAGANSQALLLVSPLTKGLFQSIVAESGGLVENSYPSLSQAEETGQGLAAKLHLANLKELRGATADELLRATDRQFHPIIDGYVVRGDPYLLAASGKAIKVPVLLGSNSNERGNYPNPHTLEQYVQFTTTQFPGAVADAMKVFPAATDAQMQEAYLHRARDVMAMGMRNWAGLMIASGVPAYLYYFDRNPPARPNEIPLGAVHTAEIVYFRNDLDTVDRPWTAQDRKLAEIMSAYLVNFAKNGDPNGPTLPQWPVYKRGNVMELGSHVGPIATPDGEQLDWLENYFVPRHSGPKQEPSKN